MLTGVKAYTDWPTIPQVFFNGEFIGGCDLLLDMHKNGELIEELKKIGIRSSLLDKKPEGEEKSWFSHRNAFLLSIVFVHIMFVFIILIYWLPFNFFIFVIDINISLSSFEKIENEVKINILPLEIGLDAYIISITLIF